MYDLCSNTIYFFLPTTKYTEKREHHFISTRNEMKPKKKYWKNRFNSIQRKHSPHYIFTIVFNFDFWYFFSRIIICVVSVLCSESRRLAYDFLDTNRNSAHINARSGGGRADDGINDRLERENITFEWRWKHINVIGIIDICVFLCKRQRACNKSLFGFPPTSSKCTNPFISIN